MGLGLVLVVATACMEQETEPSAEVARLRAAFPPSGRAVQGFRDLDPATASIEDVQAARDEIQAAWDQVKSKATDLNEADEAAVDEAWQRCRPVNRWLPFG